MTNYEWQRLREFVTMSNILKYPMQTLYTQKCPGAVNCHLEVLVSVFSRYCYRDIRFPF